MTKPHAARDSNGRRPDQPDGPPAGAHPPKPGDQPESAATSTESAADASVASDASDGPSAERRLEINEPASLRAISHPARLAAMQRLMMIGPATATELGETAGLSASAMSYHLRSLEKAGLIETAPSRGDGRERVWRSVHEGYTVDTLEGGSAEMRDASRELIESVLLVQDMRVRRWLGLSETEPDWIDTGYFYETLLNVTQDELATLNRKIQELLTPYRLGRRKNPPPGARQTSFVARGFPLADPVALVRSDDPSPGRVPGSGAG
ncbi:MAG TPA: winged helix-turn-helix domain-containing protein [Micromonosporaceae bacterium]|nr:winged helix-turn-helix domain-containing protein [Micromonosporaceae bacterium]